MTRKSINKILKWFKRIENDEYKYPKTKEELFKLEELYLCCLCNQVPKEISQLKKIKKLVVSFYGIDEKLPKSIKYFKHLEILHLGITNIKYIDVNLYKLKKLKVLSLDGNFFNYIPKGISNLNNLEELSLALYTGSLPRDIVRLKKLKKLVYNCDERLSINQENWINTIKILEKI